MHIHMTTMSACVPSNYAANYIKHANAKGIVFNTHLSLQLLKPLCLKTIPFFSFFPKNNLKRESNTAGLMYKMVLHRVIFGVSIKLYKRSPIVLRGLIPLIDSYSSFVH